jgi:hypothetical protein
MTPSTPTAGKFRFRMIGGGLQLQISKAEDIANVLLLDDALWAMTSVDTDSLRFDRRFLEFVDSDHDGKIRSNEIRDALRFVLENFRDLDGVVRGEEYLSLSSLAPDAPGMDEVIKCANLLLTGCGKAPDASLSADEIRESRIVTSFTDRNGDGVIAPESDLADELRRLIKAVIASGRTTPDRSGNDGISLADLESFEAALQRKLALFKAQEENPGILIYGEKTGELYRIFADCEALLDDYFLNSAAEEFLLTDPERTVKKEFSANLLQPENVREALASAAVAIPGSGGRLDTAAPLNPLYAEKIRLFAASGACAGHMDGSCLSESEYRKIKAEFAPFARWQQEMTKADGLENLSREEMEYLAAVPTGELKELIASDLSFAPVVSAGETLLKLALFQRYMIALLNNFVSLYELFNPVSPSHLQMGKLVMDGRHFTLTVRVKNPAEHKRIIKSSNICVIYVEISRQNGQKELLACAVTSGTMRSLFVGKHGVFFDTDNVIYDAVIKDIAEQPVSIGEAFKAPFYQFADFISKQTERIFNTRNAAMQKSMTDEMNKSQMAQVPQVPAANAPATPAPAANAPSGGMGNLPMLLMGGGIGIAALGSSIAFIANSLQDVSFKTVLAVLAGIVVIFGGPSVVIALIKIFRRNLGRFLESCGCAVNRPMRMSRKMGHIFTFVPKRPHGEISVVDPAEIFRPVEKIRKSKKFIWLAVILIVGIFCGLCAAYFHVRYLEKSIAAEEKTEEKTEEKVEEQLPQAVDDQNKTQETISQ